MLLAILCSTYIVGASFTAGLTGRLARNQPQTNIGEWDLFWYAAIWPLFLPYIIGVLLANKL